MKLKTFLFATLVFGLFSCDKYDRKPPVIEYINISGQTYGINLQAGEIYALDYGVSDNKKIRDLQIRTLKGFRSEQNVQEFPGDFNFSTGFDPDNSVKREPLRFPIPATSNAGTYRISLKAKDSNGNWTAERNLNFIIHHVDAPEVHLSLTTSFGDHDLPVYDIRRGDRIYLSGTAKSAVDMTRVKLEFLGENKSEIFRIVDLPGSSDLSLNLDSVLQDTSFKVPPTTMSGHNDLLLSVTAANGHTTVVTYRFNVLF